MFIPYNNGHTKQLHSHEVPNMSGNVGLGLLNSSQSHEFYEMLSEDASNDPLWTGDDFNEDTKVIYGGRCSHCKHWVGDKGAEQVQIQHVLNGCKSFKTQRRYHWRHETVLDYIGTLLEKKSGSSGFRCYLDVPGRRTHDDGTVPDQLLVTAAKPDIFILDQRDHLSRPEVVIIDLTIPWDDRVDAARSEKLAKFSKLVATIKANEAFNVTYQSIEIGSYRQRLSDGSESAMRLLYQYITPKMTFDAFRCNLINLVNYSSYEIFQSRKETKWEMDVYPAPPKIESTTETEPPIEDQMIPTVTELVEEMSPDSSERIEEISADISQTLQLDKDTPEEVHSQMSIFQFLAILFIFCLILLALNIMWNNLFTTLFICCITLPILRWMGKV